MKTVWRLRGSLIAMALALATFWPAVSMAQGGVDKWGLTDSDYSVAAGSDLLARSNAVARFDELIAAANAGDPKAMLLVCLGYDGGIWGYQSANYASGFCQSSANAKFPRGMRNSALYLEIGTNGAPDKVKAKQLYREAAEAGNGRAIEDYGRAMEEGWDGPPDLSEATSWYCWAADKGVVAANHRCGWGLQNGWQHGQIHLESAAKYYRQGALAGDPGAMAQYGYMLESGTGTAKDQCEATRWHRAAAEAGSMTGMENYGLALESGRCVEPDAQGAMNWYQRAVAAGSTQAGAWYDKLYQSYWRSYSTPPPAPPERSYQEWCLSHNAC
ncbi:MAG: tetratricopeptide repeat protein [Hyphomonas sp.]